jgi:hypothetical protein
VPRRKQVYQITYPNGKIYVGMDLTGSLLYVGSPSAHEQIAADLELESHQFDLTLRKEICGNRRLLPTPRFEQWK